jgi:hypothetical protein
MAGKKTFADDFTMREIAMDILKNCGGEREIILQVQRVMNSRIDTLSADMALQQLEQLRTRCATSLKPSARLSSN